MNIGIIGFGKMGATIFRLFAKKSFNIRVVTETEAKAVQARSAYFYKLEQAVKRGASNKDDLLEQRDRIRFSHHLESISSSDIILEAAFENYRIKAEIFQRLEPLIRSDSLLTTNTSSLSVQKLAGELTHKDRFCGLHFFHPIPLINLVEIVVTDYFDRNRLDSLIGVASMIEKKAIVVKDAPGSVINAILAYYYAEALYILEDGLALPSRIDEIARRFCYVGPCESLDVIGLDFFNDALANGVKAGTIYPIKWDNSRLSTVDNDNRFPYPFILDLLIKSNRLGKKTDQGIYHYDKKLPVDDSPEFYCKNGAIKPSMSPELIDAHISDRLIYSILNGSIFSLTHQMASKSDIETGVQEILHMKKGPFAFIKDEGIHNITEKLTFFTTAVGNRFFQDNIPMLQDLL